MNVRLVCSVCCCFCHWGWFLGLWLRCLLLSHFVLLHRLHDNCPHIQGVGPDGVRRSGSGLGVIPHLLSCALASHGRYKNSDACNHPGVLGFPGSNLSRNLIFPHRLPPLGRDINLSPQWLLFSPTPKRLFFKPQIPTGPSGEYLGFRVDPFLMYPPSLLLASFNVLENLQICRLCLKSSYIHAFK